jgi:hypothetical protein
MEDVMDLSSLLSDVLEEATVLDRNRKEFSTDRVREIVEEFRDAAAPILTWISEAQAVVRSGRTARQLRRQFPEWERQGYARWNPQRPRERQYLLFVIGTSHDADAVHDSARLAAREAMGS